MMDGVRVVSVEEDPRVEFLPQTQEALDEYLSLADPDLGSSLLSMGHSAAAIVPDCVGLSLTLYDEGLTFTLVDPRLPLAGAGAADVSRREPYVQAGRVGTQRVERSEGTAGLMDEDRWALFARASAAVGVASSLSLPVVEQGRVVGGINLYASSSEAFEGRHGALAAALGASAVGAVTNADLDFESRRRAEQAPGVLRDQQEVEVGIGILAAREALDVDTARERLHEASLRAGISDVQAARIVIDIHRG
jgi:GAF domain-containing protein